MSHPLHCCRGNKVGDGDNLFPLHWKLRRQKAILLPCFSCVLQRYWVKNELPPPPPPPPCVRGGEGNKISAGHSWKGSSLLRLCLHNVKSSRFCYGALASSCHQPEGMIHLATQFGNSLLVQGFMAEITLQYILSGTVYPKATILNLLNNSILICICLGFLGA